MRSPFCGVRVDEGSEFCLWGFYGGDVAAGEDVDLGDGLVVEDSG